MLGLKLDHDLFMLGLKLHHDLFMLGLKLDHDLFMPGLKLDHDLFMLGLKLDHDLFMLGLKLDHVHSTGAYCPMGVWVIEQHAIILSAVMLVKGVPLMFCYNHAPAFYRAR